MRDLQTIIRRRLKALGWTRYRLSKEVAGSVQKSTIYDYLARKKDIGTDSLKHIMEALDLEIMERRIRRRRRRAGAEIGGALGPGEQIRAG